MKERFILYHHYLGEILYVGGMEHGLEVAQDYDVNDVELFTREELVELIGCENYEEQLSRFERYGM